jgi:hypothetical protein
MKRYLKDPLLVVSVLLAVTGALQASQGFLTALVQRYPIAFGLAMTAVSCTTGVLTVLKTYLTTPRPPDTHDDGTAGDGSDL